MADVLSLIGRVSGGVIFMWLVWFVLGMALLIYTGRSLRPEVDTEATAPGTTVHIEQSSPVNSPNVIGDNNQVTVGGGPPAERSFCPDRGLVQSGDWNHEKLGCTDITIPWDAPGWEGVRAVADLTVLVNAPPGTSPIAHLRIVDLTTRATVAEQAIREVRPSPGRIEFQGVKLAVPRAKGTHSYRLEFRTEEQAATSVKGPILFAGKP